MYIYIFIHICVASAVKPPLVWSRHFAFCSFFTQPKEISVFWECFDIPCSPAWPDYLQPGPPQL